MWQQKEHPVFSSDFSSWFDASLSIPYLISPFPLSFLTVPIQIFFLQLPFFSLSFFKKNIYLFRHMAFSSCSVLASHCSGFSCCGTWALGMQLQACRVQGKVQQLRCAGLVAWQHVGSSLPRDPVCVPCTGGWVLIHWIIREVLFSLSLKTGFCHYSCFSFSNPTDSFSPSLLMYQLSLLCG